MPSRGIKLLEVNKDHKRELIPTKGTVHPGFFDKDCLVPLVAESARNEVSPEQNAGVQCFSVEGLLQFAQGVDTDYPTMAGFWNDKSTPQSLRDSLTRLLDPANRSYELDADKMRVLENNATYTITDLKTTDYDHGLEVVDLSNEQDRSEYVGG